MRDARSLLLLKLLFLSRARLDRSSRPLLRKQARVLARIEAALEERGASGDEADRMLASFRLETTRAVSRFVRRLGARERYEPGRGRLERGDELGPFGDAEAVGRLPGDLGGEGPISTRTRLPTSTTDVTRPERWFSDESAGMCSETVTSHGWTAMPTAPSRARGRVDRLPVVEAHRGQVAGPRRDPSRRLAPVRLATKASAGAETSRCGVSSWTSLPSTMTPTVSASTAASSKSWVTSRVGSASSRKVLAELGPHLVLRVGVERREGLVEEQHARVARERAGERDALALAAGEGVGLRAGRWSIRKRRSSASASRVPP